MSGISESGRGSKKMTMKLNDAIDHALEQAADKHGTPCGDEHRQLAEWLTELKERMEQEVSDAD